MFLPDAENRTIVSSFIWTKHRNLTDGRTDRRTDGRTDISSSYYSGLHCEQCGGAVNTEPTGRQKSNGKYRQKCMTEP